MHFASDMMNLRHAIDTLHHDRRKLVSRLHRFGSNLHADTAEMLSAMRKAMHDEHARMRAARGAFNAANQRFIHDLMHGLHAERMRARRNFTGHRA
jgi:DnaJ-domain-containing protein 1